MSAVGGVLEAIIPTLAAADIGVLAGAVVLAAIALGSRVLRRVRRAEK